jgi:hypothetical protein
MSTLRQSLQQHRTAESASSCVTADERQSALVVSSWQGESWVLPWSHFVSARLGGDRIELTFANVTVTLTGQNLTALLDDIAAFRLSCLRDLPADYRRKPLEGQPFITRIEVQPLASAAPAREPS